MKTLWIEFHRLTFDRTVAQSGESVSLHAKPATSTQTIARRPKLPVKPSIRLQHSRPSNSPRRWHRQAEAWTAGTATSRATIWLLTTISSHRLRVLTAPSPTSMRRRLTTISSSRCRFVTMATTVRHASLTASWSIQPTRTIKAITRQQLTRVETMGRWMRSKCDSHKFLISFYRPQCQRINHKVHGRDAHD